MGFTSDKKVVEHESENTNEHFTIGLTNPFREYFVAGGIF